MEPKTIKEINLDELERQASYLYFKTYGKPTTDAEGIFVQRGIDMMRYAIATLKNAESD